MHPSSQRVERVYVYVACVLEPLKEYYSIEVSKVTTSNTSNIPRREGQRHLHIAYVQRKDERKCMCTRMGLVFIQETCTKSFSQSCTPTPPNIDSHTHTLIHTSRVSASHVNILLHIYCMSAWSWADKLQNDNTIYHIFIQLGIHSSEDEIAHMAKQHQTTSARTSRNIDKFTIESESWTTGRAQDIGGAVLRCARRAMTGDAFRLYAGKIRVIYFVRRSYSRI